MRDASDAMLTKTGSRPKVYLIALGPEPLHRRRAAFVCEWLEAGGIEPVYDGEAATPLDAVQRIKRSGARLACLCGDDAAYASAGKDFAAALKASGIEGLLVAGKPGEAEADLRAAGVDAFIFARSRCG